MDCLYNAVKENNTELVKELLEKSDNPERLIVYSFFYGRTVLMLASEWGFTECVNILLKYGADPNIIIYPKRMTALIYASKGGSTECTRLLLEAGADRYTRAYFWNGLYFWNALDIAIEHKHKKIIKILKRMPILQLLNDY